MIWGSAFVAQRMGMSHIGPFTFNGIRFALGAVALVPLVGHSFPYGVIRRAHRVDMSGASPVAIGLFTGIVLFGAAALQQIGLVYTTAGKAGFITGLYVVIVPLLGLIWGHRPHVAGWGAVGLATFGLYLLSITEAFTFAPGDLWELGGAFLWAVHMVLLGRFAPRADPLRLARMQYLVCSGLSLVVAVAAESVTAAALWAASGAIVYGGMLSVGIAYTLQVVAQRKAPPAHAAIILSMEGVFAAVAGWLVLGETLTPRALCGCALMLVAMLMAQLRPFGTNM
jgi:drug/metabolite transporter (DMT)-like permease